MKKTILLLAMIAAAALSGCSKEGAVTVLFTSDDLGHLVPSG